MKIVSKLKVIWYSVPGTSCSLETIVGLIFPVPMRLVFNESINMSGSAYPAGLVWGVTIATFFPIPLILSYSSISMTVVFSEGEIPGPISGAP